MPVTPSQRMTRSSSNPNNSLNLSDVKNWIESSESKILSSLKSDICKITNMLESLSQRVDGIESKNSHLERRCEALEKENSDLKEEITNLSTSLKSEVFEAAVTESDNRMRRLHNIVIQGLPELVTGTLDERKSHDTEQVRRVVQEMGVLDSVIADVRRVGRKRKDGARLVVFKVTNIDSKREIFSKSRALRNSPFRHVFV